MPTARRNRFEVLAEWIKEAGVSDEFLQPEWQDHTYYNENLDRLTEAIGELCLRYSQDEVVRLGQERSLMVMPVKDAAQLLVDARLVERKVFQQVVDFPRELRLPRPPMVFSRSVLPPPRRAPQRDEHDADLLRDWLHGAPGRTAQPRSNAPRLPLEGIRVADFSWMLAAPIATRFLADLGADVIRIESHMRRDMTREIGPQPPGHQSLDTNSTQHQASSNKRSIALDLKHAESLDIARRIIDSADIVLDNYRPGTMAKWGLQPQALLKEWPHLLVVTMPAVGSTGPNKHFGAIGNGVAGYGGVNSLTGFPENPPVGVGPIVADFFAPLFTVHAILSAFHHKQLTGEGQHVDCAMLEATLWLLDTAFAECQLLGAPPARIGNRSPWMTPHGIFPCSGDDEWIAIAVSTDEQWRSLCRIAEIPAQHRDRFVHYGARSANEDEIERIVSEATCKRSRWQLALELQSAGVPAAPVEHTRDHLENDPGMSGRFAEVRHPYDISFLVQNQIIRPEGKVVPNRRAPMIGEHSDQVLRELGLNENDITQLFAKGILN